MTDLRRCPWCEGFELYRECHDQKWGRPLRDDRGLFELLMLEGAQAGFKFVGTTICYAFMQASGMVDDHIEGCWLSRPAS
jgi:3-methyladenine DNA glycosylase Tag